MCSRILSKLVNCQNNPTLVMVKPNFFMAFMCYTARALAASAAWLDGCVAALRCSGGQ